VQSGYYRWYFLLYLGLILSILISQVPAGDYSSNPQALDAENSNIDNPLEEIEEIDDKDPIENPVQESECTIGGRCTGGEVRTASRSARGFSTIWSDNFEDGSFSKWDSTPAGSEIRILGSGSTNWGGQVTQSHSLSSQKFVEGRDSNAQTNYLQKTFDFLDKYSRIKLNFYWAEQDLEADEICKVEIYDKTNGYQTLMTIGTDNDNNDGIEMSDWEHENFDLYDLSSYGLSEITDWSEIRLRFEWRAEMDTNGVPVADEWFLDDVELVGDGHPELLSGSVDPPEGDIRNNFNFSVNYVDVDNDAPFFVRLNLNGVNHSMDELDFSDTIYSDGKIFVYYSELGAGISYSYQIWTSDGLTIANTGMFSGPVVTDGPPAEITVQAEKSVLTADESLQFQATAKDAHDTLVSWEPEWSVSGGGVISELGLFEAETVGSWRVYANYTEDNYKASGFIDISVEHGELSSIAIISDIDNVSDVINSDEYIKFEVLGFDGDTNPVPVDESEINWSASGGGVLHSNGTYDANERGFWKVTANTTSGSNIITAEYSFQVLPGLSIRLEISAPENTLSAGESVLFNARVYDSDGNYFSPAEIKWSVSGGGIITDLGKFTATSVGTFSVNASYQNEKNVTISDSMEITVTLGSVKGLMLSPEMKVLTLGESFTVTAEAFDEYGNYQVVKPAWQLQGGGEFNESTAVFTASTAGEWVLEGTYEGASGQVKIFVNSAELAYITIIPANPLMVVDEELDFEARGFDSSGIELFIEEAWSVSGGGTIDPQTGLFKATETGIWTVQVNFAGIAGSTEIFVNQYTLDIITVSPPFVTLKVNESQKFSAVGISSGGVELNMKPAWSVFGTKEGAFIDENGNFSSEVSGTFKVYATSGSITGIAEVTIESMEDDSADKSGTDSKSKGFELTIPMIIIILVAVIIVAAVLSLLYVKKTLGGDPLLREQDDDEMSYEDEYEMMYGPGAEIGDEPRSDRESGVPGLDVGIGTGLPEDPPQAPGRKVKKVEVKRRSRTTRSKRDKVSTGEPSGTSSTPLRTAGPMRYDYKSKYSQSSSARKPDRDIPAVKKTRGSKVKPKEERVKKKEAGRKSSGDTKKRRNKEPEIDWDED
jgi:hypothetical protein